MAILLAIVPGIAAAASAQGDRRPDVVLLLTDQQQGAAIGVAGRKGLATPAMDALAAGGVRFTQAFCPTPQCSPARAGLLTGRYPHRAGVMGNVSRRGNVPAGQSASLDKGIPNLGRLFAAAGYETAYFGKWHLGSEGPGGYGFEVAHESAGRGEGFTSGVVDYLTQRASRTDRRRPLLLVVSWINPHDIYRINNADLEVTLRDVELPASLHDDLQKKPFPQRHFLAEDQGKPFVHYTPQAWRRYISFYHEVTEQVDRHIGRVTAELQRRTPGALVVFSSDHGDLSGAHGLPYKCPAMYEELVRVPLVISWPGHIEPGTSDRLVNLIDILPTLCDLAHVALPEGIDGRSLRPILERQADDSYPWRRAVIGQYYGKQSWRAPIRMVRTNRWKYTRYTRYGEELYDLGNDPAESNNLAGAPQHEAIRKRLSDYLDRRMKESDDPFMEYTVTDREGNVLGSD